MADLITDLVTDLTTKLETISAIQKRVIYMYDGDDLLTESGKIGLPAIGIVYNSLQGKTGNRAQGPQGLVGTVTMDIYILGGQQCVEKISQATGVKITTTEFLEQIRAAIRGTLPQPPTANNNARRLQTRVWSFVVERPVLLDESSISYLQRWQCDVGLT
jgi:hypothetical protein